MPGHRRPSLLALALAEIVLLGCVVIPRAALGQASGSAPPPAVARQDDPQITPHVEPVRLRIKWGGREARRWRGTIRIDRGTLSNLTHVDTQRDAIGSSWLNRGELEIGDLAAHQLRCVEVTAEGTAEAQIFVHLGSSSSPMIQAQLSLSELQHRPLELRLDDQGSVLEIARVADPILRLWARSGQRQLAPPILAPGEPLAVGATFTLPASLHGTTVDVHTSLHRATSPAGPPLWSDHQKVSVPIEGAANLELDIPQTLTEGAYAVRMTVSRPSGYFRDRFLTATAPLAERTIQVVVLDPEPPSAAQAAEWTRVLEIDPSSPGWMDRLPSWTQVRRLAGLSRSPLGNVRAGTVQLYMGRFTELPAGGVGPEPGWQAYSLPVEAVQEPHVLEVDYPLGDEQHFGITILNPGVDGEAESAPLDAGVVVEGLGRDARKVETARILFWPRSQTPMLVVTNRHPTAVARFGAIRVSRCRGAITDRATMESGRAGVERLVAAYIRQPLASSSLGAPSSEAGLSMFFQEANRLSEVLRKGGYNAAIVSIPVSSLGPTAVEGFDGQGMELLLRVFDRDGLRLMPALEFSAPVASLEAIRRASDPKTSGIEWVNREGQSWLEVNGTRDGSAPYYNLLDPRVQQALLNAVETMVADCSGHGSFEGIAIPLSSDGYAQLPPPGWGLDDATVARFEQDTGIAISAAGAERFRLRHEMLSGRFAVEWRGWRAQQVAKFYDRVAQVVREGGGRRLFLTTENLFENPIAAQRIRPNLREENRVEAALVDLGLDRALLGQTNGLCLCPTVHFVPTKPLADCADQLELNAAFGRWSTSGRPETPAALVYHTPRELRLPSLAARLKSDTAVASDLRIVCQPIGYSALARKPYVQSLRYLDPVLLVDGGESTPCIDDVKLRQLRQIVSRLPVEAKTTEVATQPVIVRTFSEATRTTILVMNAGPWNVRAEVALVSAGPVQMTPLGMEGAAGASNSGSMTLAEGQQPWTIILEPYDVYAVRIDSPTVRVAGVNVDLGPDATAELKRQLDDFTNRDVSAPRQYMQLSNPGFEGNRNERVPGWRLTDASLATATMQLDPTAPKQGETSLYVRCTGPFAAVQSDPFPIPATGQLAMTVFARCANPGPNTELRLVFETDIDGVRDRREAKVSCGQLVRPNQEWDPRPLAIPANDLPLDSRGTMRVSFELTGPGELWLDQVTMYDLLFPLPWYANSQAEKLTLVKLSGAAQGAFERGQLSDCLQILDGYWPQFVQIHRPLSSPRIATRPPEPAAGAGTRAADAPADSRGVIDRLKYWVPRPR